MADQKPMNSCQRCGATAYKPILLRNDAGVMRPSGRYACVQCGLVFTNIHEWRGDPDSAELTRSTDPKSDP